MSLAKPERNKMTNFKTDLLSIDTQLVGVEQILKNIADLTSYNDHSEALVQIATHFGNKSQLKIAQALKTIRDELKHAPEGIFQAGYTLQKQILRKIEIDHSEAAKIQVVKSL